MTSTTPKTKLHEAAMEGSVTKLLELLKQDPLILDRVNDSTNETPLHVAVLLGHVSFVAEILKRRPELAKDLDTRGSSVLHVAAAKGYVEIVKILVKIDADLCLLWDADGRSPLHVAAVRGRVDVVGELARARPVVARTAVDGGGTVLHLCVKHNQLEVLRMLVETVSFGDDSLVNAKDDYGFTILHLAVSNKHLRTVEYLINNTRIKVNALTTNGLTPLDILIQSQRDLKDMEISHTLTDAGAIQNAAAAANKNPRPVQPSSSFTHNKFGKVTNRVISAIFNSKHESWVLRKQDALMVAASLIATMTFQAGVSPPGGVWQEDEPSKNRVAGTSILAEKHLRNYNKFLGFNTTGFTASLIVILMLITGLPSRHLICVRALIVAMWIAVCSTAFSYGYSIRFFTPTGHDRIIFKISIFVSLVVSCTLTLFFIGKLFYIVTHQDHGKTVASSGKPNANQDP